MDHNSTVVEMFQYFKVILILDVLDLKLLQVLFVRVAIYVTGIQALLLHIGVLIICPLLNIVFILFGFLGLFPIAVFLS